MFERCTETARQAIVAAQEEARLLRHPYIGTDHLLLGLLRSETAHAAEVLMAFSMDLEGARARVAAEVDAGGDVPPDHLPFAPEARRALDTAYRAMLAWEHDHISTEHLLYGLLGNLPPTTHRVLLAYADPSDIHAAVAFSTADRPRRRRLPSAGNPVELDARSIALEEASKRGRDQIPDSGDLLVGFAEGGHGVAARALAALGVSVEALREAVRRTREEDPERLREKPSGNPPAGGEASS
ncbi:MAG: hypothetical protein M3N16_00985 [Actinomycetota bacterium]|nr:hypothetical protein [Actinomycetota bacterium]